MRALFAAALVLALLLPAPVQGAGERGPRKVERVALARALLLDGHAARALRALSEVDLSQGEIELGEYHRIRGLAEHGVRLYAEAARSFRLAMKNGEDRPATWYALANSQLSARDARGALSTLAEAPAPIWAIPGAHRITAEAHRALAEEEEAFEAACEGLLLFPQEVELQRLRALSAIALGLSREGMEAARVLLARPGITPRDYLVLAAAFVREGDTASGAALLETALLRFPDSAEPRELLARVYLEARRPLAAAQVLHPLALESPEAALRAAELYGRARRFDQALRFNGLVADAKKKVRQRLMLLIESERYAEAAALDARLSRLGLLSDEGLRYALVYAHHVSGNHRRVVELAGALTEPELLRKVAELRRAIDACAADPWRCE